MGTQKIINLLNDSSNEEFKFATKKWYAIDSQRTEKYNKNNSIKFETETIKSSLCDYDIINAGNDIDAAFKNCAPFSTCKTEINLVFIDEANHIYIAMLMYNFSDHSIIEVL